MWMSTLCEACGYQCWRVAEPDTVKAGWLSETHCTKCGKRDVVLRKADPEAEKPHVPWLKWALVNSGLDTP